MYLKWTLSFFSCFKAPLSSVVPPEPVPKPTEPAEPTVSVDTLDVPPLPITPIPEPAAPEVPAQPPALEDLPQAGIAGALDPTTIQYINIKVKPYLPPLPHSPKRLCETRLAPVPRFTIRAASTPPVDSDDPASRA